MGGRLYLEKDDIYWARVRTKAKELNSDGCTGVIDFYLDCCLEHDIAYRTGATVDGKARTHRQADEDFRHCVQSRSYFGTFSPMAWWRWAGLRIYNLVTGKRRPTAGLPAGSNP